MQFTLYWPIEPRPDTAVQAWDLDPVFHLHGCYHDPHEVILDATDTTPSHKDEVQNLLKTFLEFHTILVVGLKWANERQENI